jgi:hypothetical protein
MAVVRQKERVGDKSEQEGSPSEVSLPILARVRDGGRGHAPSGLCPTEAIRSSVETPQTLDLSRYGSPSPLISASLRFVERGGERAPSRACDQGGVQTQCLGRDKGLEHCNGKTGMLPVRVRGLRGICVISPPIFPRLLDTYLMTCTNDGPVKPWVCRGRVGWRGNRRRSAGNRRPGVAQCERLRAISR